MPSTCRRCRDARPTSRRARSLAELLRHGLLTAGFIAPQPIRALRELTRYRKTLVQERQQEVNRLHKVLESANIKLGAVTSDVLGASGRDMLAALLAGEQDAAAMAELARGRLRAKRPALRQALEGRMSAQHRVLLRHILAHLDFLDGQLEQLPAEIETAQTPFADAVALLQTIPGVAEAAASAIIAAIGTDISVSREYPPSGDGVADAAPAGAPTEQDQPG
jgi:transposase